jgi:hypothetical protein
METLKQQKDREKRERKDKKKGVSGEGGGHEEGLDVGIICYKNADCSGKTRPFTSAHNCCDWGKSWRPVKNMGQCTNCSKSQRVGTTKH